MTVPAANRRAPVASAAPVVYGATLTDVAGVLDAARRAAARSVNSIMTAA